MRWLHFSNSQLPLPSVAIFQHHQRMEFTFHNSYVIMELLSSTVIFWTELSCWHESYSNKATLLLDECHLYVNSTVVITIWLTKYPYLNWEWIFCFLRRCFLSSLTTKTFVLSYYVSLRSQISYDFRIKTIFGSSLPLVVSSRADVLFTLFVFVYVYWCPTHSLLCFCCVCLCPVYALLPLSLDCAFLIAPSVFSHVY